MFTVSVTIFSAFHPIRAAISIETSGSMNVQPVKVLPRRR